MKLSERGLAKRVFASLVAGAAISILAACTVGEATSTSEQVAEIELGELGVELSRVNFSDYSLSEMRPRPYARPMDALVDLDSPDRTLDDQGVLLKEWPGIEGYIFHPVDQCWYTLYLLESYMTSEDAVYLERAEANADALLAGGVKEDGALWFAYPFDYLLRDTIEMPAPWYSGMAQGMALSVFTRMYEVTGEDRWRTAAEETFASFTMDAPADRMFLSVDEGGNLWFEEYVHPDYPESRVVNGHMYAMWGLRDYGLQFNNYVAETLFDAGATTMANTFEQWRKEGDVSYYCAGQICRDTAWQPENYHRGVTHQLQDLALMTGDRQFLTMADTLRKDLAASTGG